MISKAVQKILKEAEEKIARLLVTASRDGDYQRVKDLAEIAEELSAISAGARKKPSRIDTELTEQGEDTSVVYPQYLLMSAFLVKKGRSPTTGRIYSHKVPIAVVRMYLKVLKELDEDVTAEAVANKFAKLRRKQIPEYQVYTLLGWSEAQGFISRKGRGQYKVKAEKLPEGD